VLAAHGSLDGRPDLEGLPLLHAKDEPWSRWLPEAQASPWPPGPATIDDSVSILMAATEGLGFAVVRWSLAAQDIERGNLALASRHVVPSRWSYWFVCPEPYAELPKVTALRDWLRQEAAAFAGPPTTRAGSTVAGAVAARGKGGNRGRPPARTKRSGKGG